MATGLRGVVLDPVIRLVEAVCKKEKEPVQIHHLQVMARSVKDQAQKRRAVTHRHVRKSFLCYSTTITAVIGHFKFIS